MWKLWHYLVVAGLVTGAYGDDLSVPFPSGGSIVVQNPQFITHHDRNQFNIESYEPILTFDFVDRTSPALETAKIQFDIGGVCNGEVRQWSEVVSLPLVFMAEHGWKSYTHQIESLEGKVQGCRTEVIKARVGEPHLASASALAASASALAFAAAAFVGLAFSLKGFNLRLQVERGISNLTVREAQQVQACQSLDLYPPR